MILVTGASGHLGRAIVSALHDQGVPHVAGTRRPDPGSGRRTVDFDLPDTLDLTGVDTLVLVSAGYAEDDQVIARHDAAISAAERDGVRHVVYTSLVGAGDVLSIALPHRWTERRLRTGTLAWTILRNGLYAELLGLVLQPVDGVVISPLGTGGLAAAARGDLAQAAALVAAEPHRHAGASYELTGPRAVSAVDVATRLGLPRHDVSLTDLRRQLAGRPAPRPFQAERLLSICSGIRAGFLADVSPDLEKLLGRPALDPLDVATTP